MQEHMIGVSFPGLLATGYLISMVIFFLASKEKDDMVKRSRMFGYAFITLGVMVAITPISWYGYWAISAGHLNMYLIDMFILATLSFVAGAIVQHGLDGVRN